MKESPEERNAMKDSLGDLRWEVPSAGHRWTRARYYDGRTATGLIVCGPEWLLTSRGPLEPDSDYREYNPLTRPKLFRRFSGLRTRAEMQAFADRWGLLDRYGHEIVRNGPVVHGELLSRWHQEIREVREALQQWRRQQWVPLQDRINARLEELVRPRLLRDADAGDQLRFHVVPRTLLGAIWLQLARAIDGNKQFLACRACPQLFEVSSERGTGRRADAKYCSDACKQRWWRRARSTRHQKKKKKNARGIMQAPRNQQTAENPQIALTGLPAYGPRERSSLKSPGRESRAGPPGTRPVRRRGSASA